MGRTIATFAAALLVGCAVPRGEPVVVDSRAGDFFSGNGVLLEVSPDQRYCRIAARGRSLLVEKKWVPCQYVHAGR